ncbi:hypothetical protein DXG01_001963, partial [Tephrocybe rancida]
STSDPMFRILKPESLCLRMVFLFVPSAMVIGSYSMSSIWPQPTSLRLSIDCSMTIA